MPRQPAGARGHRPANRRRPGSGAGGVPGGGR